MLIDPPTAVESPDIDFPAAIDIVTAELDSALAPALACIEPDFVSPAPVDNLDAPESLFALPV